MAKTEKEIRRANYGIVRRNCGLQPKIVRFPVQAFSAGQGRKQSFDAAGTASLMRPQ